MDMKKIGNAFKADEYIVYICPSCKENSLTLNNKSIVCIETASSRKYQEHSSIDYALMNFKFTAWLHCNNILCNEVVTCLGNASVDFDIEVNTDGQQKQNFFTCYTPLIFSPTLRYIQIPDKCPQRITNNLLEAFQLTLLSPSSSANKIRSVVENLLTELKVKRYDLIKRKRRRMNLHKRIEFAADKNIITHELEELLLAIKWLGNEGSHGVSELSKNDILDAYEMIEIVLRKLYAPENQLRKKVKEILKNKGIKKRKNF